MESRILIDDCFFIEETTWKTWRSYDKENKELVTSLNKENCIAATRFYLKGLQEGWPEVEKNYDGTVGGKL